jgi:ligand-binding SRPBCC domain-containing protein
MPEVPRKRHLSFVIDTTESPEQPASSTCNVDPMRYTYQVEQWLPYSLELVFAFFANPENLPRLMPSWQQARIEEAAFVDLLPHPDSTFTTIVAGTGSRLTLSFKPFPHAPIRIPWEAEITDFTWNHHFCDTQLRGPFAYWHHCHIVTSETRAAQSPSTISGTLLRDEVHYELPFGNLGALAQRFFIARQLRNTFAYRQARTLELLASLSALP